MSFLFYLLVFLLPTQLGRHFWPDFSYINGLRIDYLSPTLYLTDIIIIFLFFLYVIKMSLRQNIFLLFIFSLFSLFSVFSTNPTISFLKSIKISEMIFLGYFISRNIGKTIKFQTIVYILSLTVIYESLLALAQLINQGSVGGLFWLLGERAFNSSTPFVSQAIINGQLVLRPYGTFSHPNVLGGYLVAVMTIIIYNLQFTIYNKTNKIFYFVVLFLGTIALFLTLSRTAWVVFLLVLLFYLSKLSKKYLLAIGSIGLLVVLGIGNIGYFRLISLLGVDNQSLLIREQLNGVAVKMFLDRPMFGVGLNNFLLVLPHYFSAFGTVRFYQPVHNIYLLIASETGIIGITVFLTLILLSLKRLIHNTYCLILLLELLFLGLFDHYLFTLQQGQLLMALVFGLCWSKIKT